MSSYIVQFPGQGKLVMITFKAINELFTQKKNTSYQKNISQNNKQNVYTHMSSWS